MGLLAVLAVAMFITMPVGNGFAVSYTAATTSASNTISADYFTAGFYDSGGNAMSSVLSSSLTYVKATDGSGVTTYSITDGTVVSVDNLYFRINNENTHVEVDRYSITVSCTCAFKVSENSSLVTVSGATMSLVLKDGSDAVVNQPAKNVLYKAILTIASVSTSSLANDPTLLSIVFSVDIEDTNTASVANSNTGITITGSGSTVITDDTTAATAVDIANEQLPDSYSFQPSSGSTSSGSSGNTYTGGYGVTVSNGSNTITSGGKVNVSLNTVSGSLFAITLCRPNSSSGGSSTMSVIITLDDDPSKSVTVSGLSKGSSTYLIYNNSNGNIDKSVITKTNGSYNIPSAISNNNGSWLTASKISIQNSNGDGSIIFDIVIKS